MTGSRRSHTEAAAINSSTHLRMAERQLKSKKKRSPKKERMMGNAKKKSRKKKMLCFTWTGGQLVGWKAILTPINHPYLLINTMMTGTQWSTAFP